MREARLRAGIPQDRLGVLIGIDEESSSARISRYETGVHQPPFAVLERIAEVLHVPQAYFFCESDELAELVLLFAKLAKDQQAAAIQEINRMLSAE